MRDVPFTRSLPHRLLRRHASMSADWDERARRNALFYICKTAAESRVRVRSAGPRASSSGTGLQPTSSPWKSAAESGGSPARLPAWRVYAGDVSPEMLARAKEYCAGHANIELLRIGATLAGVLGSGGPSIRTLVFQHVRVKLSRASEGHGS
jgi:hypothetical protein